MVRVTLPNIPDELKALHRWGRSEKGSRKPLLKNSSLAGWTSFDKATAHIKPGEPLDHCIGLVLMGLDGFVFIDLDACIVNHHVTPWAQEILDRFPVTYTEYSPSGIGLRLVYSTSTKVADRGSTKIPGEEAVNDKKPGFEVYGGEEGKGQWITITGNSTEFPPEDIAEIDLDALAWLLEKYPKQSKSAVDGKDLGDMPEVPEDLPEVDEWTFSEISDARSFWLDGLSGDRSASVYRIAQDLLQKFSPAEVLGLMEANEHCALFAEEKSPGWIWTYCIKAAAKKAGAVQVVDHFDDLGADNEKTTAAEIARLARLSPSDYEAERKKAAKDLGWRPSALDAAVKGHQKLTAKVERDGYSRNNKGQIVNSAGNLSRAMKEPKIIPGLGYDTFRDEIMFYEKPGEWQSMNDAMVWEIRRRLCDVLRFDDTSAEKTRAAIHHAAWDNRFDSAQVWLYGLKWDGVPRVNSFCSRYLGAEDSDYTQAVSRYLWTAAAGRIIEPGCKADSAVVLVSPEGRRKSSAVRAMCPGDDFFTELNLQIKDSDISRQLRGKLIAEWSELTGMSRKEVDHVKAFTSRQTEAWTPKFKEFETKFPRRCIFIGTTNEEDFLASHTGNRRFYPMQIDECDFEAVKRDRDQLWAEAAVLFEKGGVDWEGAHTLGRPHQEIHEIRETELSDKIQQWLDSPWFDDLEATTGAVNADREDLSVLIVAEGALEMKAKEIHQGVKLRISRAMKQLGWELREVRVKTGGNPSGKTRRFRRRVSC